MQSNVDSTERKQAEEALKESEADYRRLFKLLPVGVTILDLKGVIIYCNSAVYDKGGYSEGEFDGKHFSKIASVRIKDIPKYIRVFNAIVRGKTPEPFEAVYQHKDGTTGWTELNIDLVKVGGKQRILVIQHDITERKQMEDRLRESEERLKAYLEGAPDGVYINDTKGTLLYGNKKAEDLTGYKKEELLGTSFLKNNILPVKYLPKAIKTLARSVMGKPTGPDEFELNRKDGSRVWVEINSTPIKQEGELRIIGFVRDITERKQAEQTLGERVKELSCLYGIIAKIFEKQDITLDELYQEITNLLPQGWQYPETTCARVSVNGKIFETENFKDTRWWQSADIKAYGEKIGIIEVYYLEEKPEIDEGPFLKEERYLIDAAAKHLGKTTERKQAEEALRINEERLRLIADNATDMISRIQMAPTIRTDYVSPSCFRITGYKQEEFYADPNLGLELVHPEDREFLQKSAVPDKKNPYKTISIRLRRKDGKVIWVEQTHTIITDEHGKPVAMHVIARDITERKQMEEALAASESDKKSILNAISDLVIFQDSSLTTKWANEAAARSIGKSPQDLVGKHCYQLWHKRNKPCDDCPVIRALETKSSVSGSMTTPDGRSWDVSGEPVYDSDGKIIGAIEIARDITERKRAEEALRINEERFRLIADNATDLISRIQMAPTIRTDYVSPSCLRFTGYKQEEFYNDPNLGLEMIHPDDREFFQKYLTSDNKKHQKPITIRLVRKDGSIIWIEQTHSIISDENGEPVAMHLIARDITERKRAEEALANEAIRRRILIEQSGDGIVVLDQNGNVYESNRRFAEMLGYSLEEVRQLQVWDWEFLYPPEQVREMLRSVDETGDHFETQHRRKDGTIYDVEISTNGATFAGQKLIFCVCRDITGRIRAGEKLKQALSELEQSSARLAATNKELETFSYSVSHDLRSPLRSIYGFSQALLEDYSDKLDENGQDYLKRLRGASQKMGELIDGLLKLSRLTRSEMHAEPVDLSALAEEIATRLQEMRQGHRAKFIIDKGLTANGDPQLLRVLLENLLGNAWKFTGKTPHAKIEFGTTRNNGKKTYFVKDNGAGFDMTYADKLFGAFQRLHDGTEFPGIGIGLATVQRIINRHGGTIQAEGAVGKGATFYFTLD